MLKNNKNLKVGKGRKYQRPDFLYELVSQQIYEKWLSRKAQTHFNRDKERDGIHSTCQEYKKAIHKAVYDSNGRDAYTGRELEWGLISTFNSADAQEGGRKYRARFADLPTVDHIRDAKRQPSFKICSWKVNDAKNDLTLNDFIKLCKDIIKFHERSKN